jgi:ApaG protein
MVNLVTNGIKVMVETSFNKAFSKPHTGFNLFNYQVTLVNQSDYTVKLLRRHWYIIDSNGERIEVEGEGVVGQQPELEPGESYTYESACNLISDMGKMFGTYSFVRKVDDTFFKVAIPEFQMIVPFRMN